MVASVRPPLALVRRRIDCEWSRCSKAVAEPILHRVGVDVFGPGAAARALDVGAEIERGVAAGGLGEAAAVGGVFEGDGVGPDGDASEPVLPVPGEAACAVGERVAVSVVAVGSRGRRSAPHAGARRWRQDRCRRRAPSSTACCRSAHR